MEGSVEEEKSDEIAIPNALKKMKWQHIALIAAIIFMMSFEIGIFSKFNQLNSPLYGGDIYYHFGVTNHIYNGNSVFSNSHFLGEYAHYPWLYHLSVLTIAKLTGFGLMKTAIFFPIIITILGGIIMFFFGRRIFKDDTLALLLAIYWMTFMIPNSLPAPFSAILLFPLFAYVLCYHSEGKKSILAGVLLGLTALGHIAVFAGSILFVIVLFLQRILKDHVLVESSALKLKNLKETKKTIFANLKWVAPIAVIGVAISMLFWYHPFFTYHGETPNRWAEYVAAGEGFTFQIFFDEMRRDFFDTRSLSLFLISFISIGGIALFLLPANKKIDSIPLIIFLAAFIGFIHPLFTLPTLGTSIGSYGFNNIFFSARPLLFISGVWLIRSFFKDNKIRNGIVAAAFLIVILNANITMAQFENDVWTQAALQQNSFTQAITPLADWTKKNVGENEAILSPHPESGFAINALTGKKVVVARRTHASPFVDINKRNADAAVMLYGKNDEKVKELLKEYSVKYIYEDVQTFNYVNTCLQFFQVADDPQYHDASISCLTTNFTYKQYLTDNGVEFVQVKARLDPASSVAPKFDLLAIKPTNISRYLANNTEVANVATAGDQVIATMMRIKT